MRPDVTPGRLSQGRCLACGTLGTASLPSAHASGYGPRWTGFVGAMAGMVGASRRAVQALGASGCSIALSTGALQQMVARVSEAIGPPSPAIGEVARPSVVNYIDETSWLLHGARPWLWGMAHPAVADVQLHPHRSKAAVVQLIGDWTGRLVREGDRRYQAWEGLRQRCWAQLSRAATGLAECGDAGIAHLGSWVHAE